MNNYLLITPMKNEENTIERVIHSVKSQTVRPVLWIIVNDGSTDRSREIVENLIVNEDWIKLDNKTVNISYNWLGYSNVINEGLLFYSQLDKELIKTISFIALLDSDITLENNYFELCINELNQYPELAVISGDIYIEKNNKWVIENKSNNPRGGARIYKSFVLDKIGGFPKTPSPDRMSDIKIQNRGYKIKKISTAKAYQHRETFSRDNKLKGYYLQGKGRYILHYSLLHIILISTQLVFRFPFLMCGISFFWGYLHSFINKEKRIDDKEIIDYSKKFYKRIL